ncbi:MAG: hypothetical protein CMM52_05635 [Rhodospirillaceae bacterium]|nr:hypothetical protein [Rhodospirillaceae bacterium]|tara:strand:+ start:4376 stop:5458 length:1083 start_codon:yes stop_codon:yes gene_type:complete
MIFWSLIALVVLAPLPFGSIYPWAWSSMAVIVAILLFCWCIKTLISSNGPTIGLNRTWFLILPFALVCGWVGIQMAPWTPESWHHPLWKDAAEILGKEIKGSISLVPFETGSGLLRLLTFGGIFWLAMQYGRNHQDANKMILALICAGTVYSIYGLYIEFTGSNTILWFEKERYKDNLTSTFRYKNSFATYAGIVVICSLGFFFRQFSKLGEESLGKFELRRQVITWLLTDGWKHLLPIVIVLTALILSDSRAGLFCTILGVVTLIAAIKVSHLKNIPYFGKLSFFAIAIIMGIFINSGSGVFDRLVSERIDTDVRGEIFASTFDAIVDRPILGYGSGTFENSFYLYHQKIRSHLDNLVG